ncbi:MAG: class I SAM-dependent DNA methyltransferase, partial [Kiritimatiellia bacterium]
MRILMLCLIAMASIPKIDQEPMKPTSRYKHESKTKSNGVIYTPREMAHELASEMVYYYADRPRKVISILDPAIGEAELPIELIAILHKKWPKNKIRVVGFDIDPVSCDKSTELLRESCPFADVDIRNNDFLLAVDGLNEVFDFVIANPPYVRTQILGADKAREIASKLGLTGRVDIYYAFLVATAKVLAPHGVAGYITSNKFFSIKSGVVVRKFMMENYKLYSLVDYGDTKVFENAAVLPCTIVFGLGNTEVCENVSFTTIYQTE